MSHLQQRGSPSPLIPPHNLIPMGRQKIKKLGWSTAQRTQESRRPPERHDPWIVPFGEPPIITGQWMGWSSWWAANVSWKSLLGVFRVTRTMTRSEVIARLFPVSQLILAKTHNWSTVGMGTKKSPRASRRLYMNPDSWDCGLLRLNLGLCFNYLPILAVDIGVWGIRSEVRLSLH